MPYDPQSQSRTISIRGAELSVDSEGSGPLVVFAHGVMGDGRSMEDNGTFDWSPVAEAGHRLVRLDWRGHGGSTGDPVPDQYTWASLGQDLLALLDVLSPDEPVAAIGCSMGTASILHAAVAAPHRFSRLVLTAPPTAWGTRAAQSDGYRRLAEIADQGGIEAVLRVVAEQPPQGVPGEAEEPPRFSVSDRLLGSVLRGAASTDLPGHEDIRTLQIPTLILSWAGDPSHPVTTGELLHADLDRSDFAVAQSSDEVSPMGSACGRIPQLLTIPRIGGSDAYEDRTRQRFEGTKGPKT